MQINLNSTVIVAKRRRGEDTWESCESAPYTERLEIAKQFREWGYVVKIFPTMMEYREDVNKKLDKHEAKFKQEAILDAEKKSKQLTLRGNDIGKSELRKELYQN